MTDYEKWKNKQIPEFQIVYNDRGIITIAGNNVPVSTEWLIEQYNLAISVVAGLRGVLENENRD